MAKFIGSQLKTDNWGEDYFIKKLMEYFDDSYVIEEMERVSPIKEYEINEM